MANWKVLQTDRWVKENFNSKAYIERSDPRCGRRYAVATKDEDGRPTYWTDFLPIDMLNEVVMMLINYNSFIKIKEA